MGEFLKSSPNDSGVASVVIAHVKTKQAILSAG